VVHERTLTQRIDVVVAGRATRRDARVIERRLLETRKAVVTAFAGSAGLRMV
jgi:hypothetical protein